MALLLGATPARADKRASTAELAEEGLTDPRLAKLPRRHRFRIALLTDYVRATRACNANQTRCTRFHFVPLTVDFAYQLQFLRYLTFRPSLALGPNVGNSRHAMPFAVQPGLYTGYQGALVGFGLSYSYILVFPARANADNGRGGLGQPLLWNDHLVQGEVSLTTRIDRGALTFAVRLGALNANLLHYDIDRYRWFFRLGLTAGWFWDVGKKRRSRARARSNAT
ncbi:MAG: hypothetical protein KC636_14905 [Myxococcales bacterium]|nr:hypothetical protein [Myxococcales bacterium]